jgi:hypothetical protein
MDKELSQTEADLLVLEWERLGNCIISMQKDHLVLLSQSKEIIKIISPSRASKLNDNYFSGDSLSALVHKHHNALLDLQDSTNRIYIKYMDERKSFSTYHRMLKSYDLPIEKSAMLKTHFSGVIRQLDKNASSIRKRLTATIDSYNSTVAALIETSFVGYQLSGSKLKIR